MKKDRWASIISSILFFAPAYVAFNYEMIITGSIFVLSGIASMIYHYNKPEGFDVWWHNTRTPLQNFLLYLDTLLALAAAAAIVMVTLTKGIGVIGIVGLVLLGIGFVSMFALKHYYKFSHSGWHIFSAVASLLILL